MSTYKEPIKWIKESVESILNQTYKNIEFVIIIDDPTNSEIINILREYSEDQSVKIYINEKNLGLVQSLNKGLKYCTGDYIARMDADDISLANRLEFQIKYLKDKKYDLIGCDYEVFFDNSIIRTAKGSYSNEVCKKILKYESCIAHPTWLVKRNVYETLQGYRNIDTCEDLDFLLRAELHGFKLGNCPHVLLKYRDNPNSISHLKNARQQSTARLLTKKYCKSKIISDKEYKEFLGSKKFTYNCNKEKRIYDNITNLKNRELRKTIRIISFIKLLSTPRYIFSKIKRIKIKLLKKNE